jgi:hypothetical protein
VDRGDTAAALAAVNAALKVDPHFLAALSLRERIIAGDLPPAVAPPPPSEPAIAPPLAAMPAIDPLPAIEPFSTIDVLPTTNPLPAMEPFSTIEPLSIVEPLSMVEPLSTIEPLSFVELLSTVEPVPTVEPMPIEPLSAFEAILASEPFSTIEPSATPEPLSAIEPMPTIEPLEPLPTIDSVPSVLTAPAVTASAPPIAVAPVAIVTPDEISTRPFVSAEGYAKFEQRAKRRRVDRRIEAARQAIDSKRLKQAAAALDEVIELDPNLPELSDLTVEFDQLRRSAAAGTHRGPWLAAGAVFAATVFGASWLQESSSLLSRSMIAAAPLLAAPTTTVLTNLEPVATTGETAATPEPADTLPPAPMPKFNPSVPMPAASTAGYVVTPAPVLRPAVEPVVETAAIVPPPAAPQPPPIAIAPMRPAQEAPVVAPATLPVPPKMNDIDDHALVQQTLQRYRSAYEDLDAQSAHAVWPAVNQVALARAFDGLASQTLTFNACDVRVRGEAATATCEGSAQYVPKIGNRQPHVEPRVWNFTLHKAGTDWKIDSARAERN